MSSDQPETFRIGDLARLSGVPPRMIRYYEQQGLLRSTRAENNYRHFTAADLDRVRAVRGMIQAGLPTRLISVVLDMREGSRSGWTEQCTRTFAETLAAELSALDRRIEDLERSRSTIHDFLRATDHADVLDSR